MSHQDSQSAQLRKGEDAVSLSAHSTYPHGEQPRAVSSASPEHQLNMHVISPSTKAIPNFVNEQQKHGPFLDADVTSDMKHQPLADNVREDGPSSHSGNSIKSSESSDQSAADDEEVFLDFETTEGRPNNNTIEKKVSVANNIGLEDQWVFRKVIKQYSEKNKLSFSGIEEIGLSFDLCYPLIRLTCELSDRFYSFDLLEVFRGSKERDPKARNMVAQLYLENYRSLSKDDFKNLFPVLVYRQKYTQSRFVGELDVRDPSGMSKIIAAAYSLVPNQTAQFLFVDVNFNCLEFNNFFIEKYQDRFVQAFRYYEKNFKPLLTNQVNGPLVLQDILDETMKEQEKTDEYEDEEKEEVKDSKVNETTPIPAKKPLQAPNLHHQLNELFEQSLKFASDKVNAKLLELQLLKKSGKGSTETAEVLWNRIHQMETCLNNYKNSRSALKLNYKQTMQARMSEYQRATTIINIWKQLKVFRNQLKSQLPIISRKKELFQLLSQTNLVLLEGETGSGKSTQLPQMMCEYYQLFTHSSVKPVVLTQPRKITAKTLAERIAFEMEDKIHGFVDYVASSGRQPNKKSKIVVMLDRLLLDELQADPLLSKYSCLILDEAHERTLSIDIIVGMVKNILINRKDFKVIITSATLDAETFEQYFSVERFRVSGRLFPVSIFYKPYPQVEETTDKIYKCLTVEILDERKKLRLKFQGHVLAFCTGVDQINQLCERMKDQLDPQCFQILALHGKLKADQQASAFADAPGKFKIIFCTRIAETAITIDGVKVVIDPGEDRENVYDQQKRISSYVLRPISLSAAKQRAGRAGRTFEGFCFRLYDEKFETTQMPAQKTPEIEKMTLDTLVLRLKSLKIDPIKFKYLTSPEIQELQTSMISMFDIGALDENFDITSIGRFMVKLPIQPSLGRAIVEAIMMRTLDAETDVVSEVVRIIALMINNQSLFYRPQEKKQDCDSAKFQLFSDRSGDFFSLLDAYEGFDRARESKQRLTEYLEESWLSKKCLFETKRLVEEIQSVVDSHAGDLTDIDDELDATWQKMGLIPNRQDLIMACLIPSVSKNICLYSGDPNIGYTLLDSQTQINIYGSSFLAIQGLTPKWIVCYDIFETRRTYCRIAQEVSHSLLKIALPQATYQEYKIAEREDSQPFYQCVYCVLPTLFLEHLKEEKLLSLNKMKGAINVVANQVFVCMPQQAKLEMFEAELKRFTTFRRSNRSYKYYPRERMAAVLGDGCVLKQFQQINDLFVTIYPTTQQFSRTVEIAFSTCRSVEFQNKRLCMILTSDSSSVEFLRWWNALKKDNRPNLSISPLATSNFGINSCLKLKVLFSGSVTVPEQIELIHRALGGMATKDAISFEEVHLDISDGDRKQAQAAITIQNPNQHLTNQYIQTICSKFRIKVVEVHRGFCQLAVKVYPRTFQKLMKKFHRQQMGSDVVFSERNDQNQVGLWCFSLKTTELQAAVTSIRELFRNFSMKLLPEETQVLRNAMAEATTEEDKHERIFQQLEYSLASQPTFEFHPASNEVIVYCQHQALQEICESLQRLITRHSPYTVKLSYRGKDLRLALKILQNFRNIGSSIEFEPKTISLTGERKSIVRFITQWEQTINQVQLTICEICQMSPVLPIKLFNCKHSFCHNCLVLRLYLFRPAYPLHRIMCPAKLCQHPINMHDLKVVLPPFNFSLMCDDMLKLTSHGCFTPNCLSMFEISATKARQYIFKCSNCSKRYCLICKCYPHRPDCGYFKTAALPPQRIASLDTPPVELTFKSKSHEAIEPVPPIRISDLKSIQHQPRVSPTLEYMQTFLPPMTKPLSAAQQVQPQAKPIVCRSNFRTRLKHCPMCLRQHYSQQYCGIQKCMCGFIVCWKCDAFFRTQQPEGKFWRCPCCHINYCLVSTRWQLQVKTCQRCFQNVESDSHGRFGICKCGYTVCWNCNLWFTSTEDLARHLMVSASSGCQQT